MKPVADCYAAPMGTVSDYRRANMLLLIERMPGKTQKAFADKADIVPAYVSQLAQSRGMGDEIARRIETKFGLQRGQMDRPNLGEFDPGPEVARSTGVPIVGRAALLEGENGYFVEEDYPAGHGDGFIDHPAKDPNAYSLRVVGDSMTPAIRSGWIVVVEPNLSPIVGEYVHALTKKGQHMIKEFLHQKEGSVVLNSINGNKRLTIALDDLEYVRPVTGLYPPSKRRL